MKHGTVVRSVLFGVHLSVAVVIGIVVFVLSVTGALLAYERELVGRPTEATAAAVVGVRRTGGDGQAGPLHDGTRVSTGPDNKLGAALRDARPTTPMRTFFSTVERVHRSLALTNTRGTGGGGRSLGAGRTIVDVCNAAFLFLIVTGIYLWLPRRWSTLAVKRTMFLHRGARGRHRDWNWHHVFGFWMALPLLLIVGAGVLMSYRAPRVAVEQMFGVSVEPASPQGERPRGAPGPVEGARQGGGDRARSEGAEGQVGEGRGRRQREDGRPSGDEAQSERRPQMDPALRKFRRAIRGIHTGQIGGLVGETLAALASLAAAALVWTGLALSWRRFWRKFRPASATLAES